MRLGFYRFRLVREWKEYPFDPFALYSLPGKSVITPSLSRTPFTL